MEKLGKSYLPAQAPGGSLGSNIARVRRAEGNPDVRNALGMAPTEAEILASQATGLRPNTLNTTQRTRDVLNKEIMPQLKEALQGYQNPNISGKMKGYEEAAHIKQLLRLVTSRFGTPTPTPTGAPDAAVR